MKHCLVTLNQVCSVVYPRVQNAIAAEGLGFENEICLKIFSSRLRCLKFGMLLWPEVLYQVCPNSGPGVQTGPAAGGPGF